MDGIKADLDPNHYIAQIQPIFNTITSATGTDPTALDPVTLEQIRVLVNGNSTRISAQNGAFNFIESFDQGFVVFTEPVNIDSGSLTIGVNGTTDAFVQINGSINMEKDVLIGGALVLGNTVISSGTVGVNVPEGIVGKLITSTIVFNQKGSAGDLSNSIFLSNSKLYFGNDYFTVNSNLTSTVEGLGTASYISTLSLTSTTDFILSNYLTNSNFFSSIDNLGTIGYISTSGLTSTVFSLNATVFNPNMLLSTVEGLGSANYISTVSLTSTVFSLSNEIIKTIVNSSIVGLGTANYISSYNMFKNLDMENIFSSNITSSNLNASTLQFVPNQNGRKIIFWDGNDKSYVGTEIIAPIVPPISFIEYRQSVNSNSSYFTYGMTSNDGIYYEWARLSKDSFLINSNLNLKYRGDGSLLTNVKASGVITDSGISNVTVNSGFLYTGLISQLDDRQALFLVGITDVLDPSFHLSATIRWGGQTNASIGRATSNHAGYDVSILIDLSPAVGYFLILRDLSPTDRTYNYYVKDLYGNY